MSEPVKLFPNRNDNVKDGETQSSSPLVPDTPKTYPNSTGILRPENPSAFFYDPNATTIRRGTSLPIDRSKYAPYMDEVRLERGITGLNRLRANNQSFGEQALNFGGQVIGEVAGIVLSGFGSFLELSAKVNPIAGLYRQIVGDKIQNDDDFSNILIRAGEGLRQLSKDVLPIYQKNPNKSWQVDDTGWWLGNGVSIASTIGMFLPGLAFAKGASLFGKLARLGELAEIGAAGKLGTIGKFLTSAIPQTTRAKQITDVLNTAFGMRHAENITESFQVVNEVRKNAMNAFADDKTFRDALDTDAGEAFRRTGKPITKDNFAKFLAGTAGHRAYNINSLNLFFDIFQSAALMKTNFFTRTGRKAGRAVIEANTGKAFTTAQKLTSITKNTGIFMLEPISEGIEEMVNFIGTKQAEVESSAVINNTREDSMIKTLTNSLKKGKIWEQGFFGSIGGAFFAGGARLKESLGSEEGKANDLAKIGEIKRRTAALKVFNKQIKAIGIQVEEGKITKRDSELLMKNAQDELATDLGLSAAASGNVDLLLDTINNGDLRKQAIGDLTVEELKRGGVANIDESIERMKETILATEKFYNYAVNKFDVAKVKNDLTKVALVNAFTKLSMAERNSNLTAKRHDAILREEYEKSPEYTKLVEAGVNVDAVLNDIALKSIRKESTNKEQQKIIDEMIADNAKLFDEKASDISSLDNETIMEESVNRAVAHVGSSSYKLSVQNLFKKDTINNIDNKVSAKIKSDKDKIAEKEYNDYVRGVLTSLTSQNVEQQIAIIENEIANNTDKRKLKFLHAKLAHFKAIQTRKAEKASATPIQKKESVETPNEAETAVPEDNLQKAVFAEHDKTDETSDAFADVVEKVSAVYENKEATTSEKIAALNEAIKEVKAFGYDVTNTVKYFEDAIKREQSNVEFDTLSGITVGETFEKDGKVVTVVKLTVDDDNSTRVTFKDGNNIYSLLIDDFNANYKLVNELVENDISLETLNGLKDASENGGQTIALDDFLTKFGIDVLPEFIALASGYTIVFTDNAGIALDRNARTLSINIATLMKEHKANNVAEIFQHELAHIAVVEDGVDANIDALDDSNLQINTTSEFTGSRAQEIRTTVYKKRGNKRVEETLIYYLTNQEFFEMLQDESNKETKVILDELIKNSTLLKQLLDARLHRMGESVVEYTTTPMANQLMQDMGINPNVIEGTGKDGKITKADVVKYIKKNKLVSKQEAAEKANVKSVPEPILGTNIFIPFINNAIVNGKVDAEAYNAYVNENFPNNPITITQEELENAVRFLLSPYFNAAPDNGTDSRGSTITLSYVSPDVIGIYSHDNILLGFVNNPKQTLKTIKFIQQLLNLKNVNEVNEFAQNLPDSELTKGNKSLIDWRARELDINEKGKKTDKSLSSELERFKVAYDNEIMLHDKMANATEADSSAIITTQVVRKSSGNFTNASPISVSEVFPDLEDLFHKEKSEIEPILTSLSNGDKFNHNPNATDYFNHDEDYTYGIVYALVRGANSISGQLDTMIPVPLYSANANKVIAEEATTIILKLIDTVKRLTKAGETGVYNHPEVVILRKELQDFFQIDFDGTLEENYLRITDTMLSFDFVKDGEVHNFHIRFSERKSGDTSLRDSKTKKRQPEGYQEANTFPFISGSGNKVGQLSVMNEKNVNSETKRRRNAKNKKVFRLAIVDALQHKRTHINYENSQEAAGKDKSDFRGTGKTYLKYMIDNNSLTTSVRPLRDGKGKIMRDEYGDVLPPVTGKYNNIKNGSFIISIAGNATVYSDSLTEAGRRKEQSLVLREENEPKVTDKNKRAEIKAIIDDIVNKVTKQIGKDSKHIIKSLIDDGEYIIKEDESAPHIALAVKRAIPSNYNITLDGNKLVLTKDSSYKKSDKVRHRTIREGDEKLDKIDESAVKEWWAETFGSNIALDMSLVGMINKGGIRAWGYFEDAMVTLSRSAPLGTEFHEGYHVVHWLYLNDKDRAAMIEEAKAEFGNIGLVALEEKIADKFADYMLTANTNSKKRNAKGKIASIFRKLLNWINNLFTYYGVGTTKTEQVFSQIKQGKFNYDVAQSVLDAAKNITRLRIVEGMTSEQEQEVIGVIAKKVITHKGTAEISASNNNYSIKEQIRQQLASEIENVSDDNALNILEATEKLRFDKLWAKATNFLEQQYKITINEEFEELGTKSIENNWDDSIFSTSTKKTATVIVKQFVATIGTDIVGNYLGLNTFVDFNKVYPYIQRIMTGADTIEEMLNRLEVFSKLDKSIANMREALLKDRNLMSAWFTTFSKQLPERDYINFGENRIKIDRSNKKSSYFILANEWSNTFVTKLEAGVFDEQTVREINKLRIASFKDLSKNEIGNAIEKVTKALNLLGVDINNKTLEQALNMYHIKDKRGESTSKLFKRIVAPVFNLLIREIPAYNKNKDNYNFRSIKRLNDIARLESLFRQDLLENSGLDVKGDITFSLLSHNYLSLFMQTVEAVHRNNLTQVDNIRAKERLLGMLKNFAKDKALQNSNWLWAHNGNDGMLYYTGKTRNPELLTIDNLNLDFIEKFGYSLLDGLKNTQSRDSAQYKNMSKNDWDLTQILMYLGGRKNGISDIDGTNNIGTIKIAIPNPADSSNSYFVESMRYTGVDRNGTVKRGTPIHNALVRLVYQDINAAIAARDLMFDYNDEDGSLSIRKDLDKRILIRNYHFVNIDSNGEPILLDENGQPTGRVFQHHNIKQADGIGFQNRIPNFDKGETVNLVAKQKIFAAVDAFIIEQASIAKELFGKYKEELILVNKFVETFGTNIDRFTTEFILNFKISTVEQQNFFTGRTSFYSNNILDPNKRAKQISSPGQRLSSIAKKSYISATISDILLSASSFDKMAESVAIAIRKEFKHLRRNKLDIKAIKNKEPVNEIDKKVFDIIGDYLDINTGDAQGYITLSRFRDIQIGYGRLTTEMDTAISNAEAGIPLSHTQLKLLLTVKGFYFGNEFNEDIGLVVPNQIKYSTVPLIPQLINDNDLELLNTWMQDNKLDEVVFESAEKVGGMNTLKIADKDGRIIQSQLDKYSSATYSFRKMLNKNWRLQTESPDHFVDNTNRLGTQIVKRIITNLDPNATYKYAGKSVNSRELIRDLMSTISLNIKNDAEKLLTRMGVTIDDNGEYIISDIEKIHKVLENEIKRQAIPENYSDAIELVNDFDGEKKFNMPLFMSIMEKKWESVLSSLFTKNVINQKQAGGSLVLMSSAFITNKLRKAETISEDDLRKTKGTTTIKGIEWSKEKLESGSLKLAPPTMNEDGVTVAEILIPRWSKHLYKDGEPISIDDIDSDILEQIWYRIPYEGKGSSVIAKVVGFLPNAAGNIIVTPHELITMSGEDHDYDKRYGMYLNLFQDYNGNIQRYRMYDQHSDDAFNQWLVERKNKKYIDELNDNPTNALKNIKKQLARFTTIKKHVDIMANALYSEQEATFEYIFNELKAYLGIEANIEISHDEIWNLVKDGKREYTNQLQTLNDSIADIRLNDNDWAIFIDNQKAIIDNIKYYQSLMDMVYVIQDKYSKEWNSTLLTKGAKSVKNETETDISAFKKAQLRRREMVEKYINLHTDTFIAELRKTFNSLSIEEINSREARENHIIDIMSSILKNSVHFNEMLQPSGFSNSKTVMAELDEILSTDKLANSNSFSNYETQRNLRARNVDGMALKSMSVNAHSFVGIMQVTKMELRRDLAHITKHTVQMLQSVTKLKEIYGEDNVISKKVTNYVLARNISNDELENIADPREFAIASFFIDGGKISSASYRRFGDINRIKDADVLRYINNKGRSIDDIADELSSETFEITPQDFVDFMDNYKSTKQYINKLKQTYENINGQGRIVVETASEIPGYVFIRHSRTGWNVDGTYKNIEGQLITNSTQEILSLALDIVKEGMIQNVNTYTFNTFITMLFTGVGIRYSSMFMNQPLLRELSNEYFNNSGILNTNYGQEISKIKNNYYLRLINIKEKLGSITQKSANILRRKASGNAISKKDAERYLGIKEVKHQIDNEAFSPDGEQIFTADELKENISYFYNEYNTDIASGKHAALLRAERFLISQLYISEKFLKYKEAGEAYSDGLKAMSTDRTSAGPSISNTLKLRSDIYFAAHYQENSADESMDAPFIESAKAKNVVINRKEVDDASSGVIADGARLFIKVGTDKIPAVVAIYPEHFGKPFKSVYPLLDAHRMYGFELSYSVISKLLLRYHPSLVQFSDDVHKLLGKRFDVKLFNKATTFAITDMMSKSPWLVDSNKDRILGVTEEVMKQNQILDAANEIEQDTEISIEDFNKLSAANKLYLIKKILKDELTNKNHFLNYLFPKLRSNDVARVGYQSIEFLNALSDTTLDNNLTNTFLEMWNSTNPYVASLARDLVKYSFFTTGFSQKLNSFAKLIPVDIFTSTETGLASYMEGVSKSNVDAIVLDETLLERFIQSVYYDSSLVPKINRMNVRLRERFIIKSNDIMFIYKKNFEKSGNAIQRSKYLSVDLVGRKRNANGEYQVFKMGTRLYKFVEEKDGYMYYMPISKLGNTNILETKFPSIVKNNNTRFSESVYQEFIDGNNTVNKNAVTYEAKDASAAYELMWPYATAHIGGLPNSRKNVRSFVMFADKAFKIDSNRETYTTNDLVMITAETRMGLYGNENARDLIVSEIKDSSGKEFLNQYKKIDDALASGATVMLASIIDSKGNAIPSMSPAYNIGIAAIQQKLETMAKNGEVVKSIDNGIAYYATFKNLKTIDENRCL